jgi:hypothetical protein
MFLDAQYWAKIAEEQTQVLVYYQTKLRDVQDSEFVTYTVCLKSKCTDFPMDELEM